MVVEKIKNRIEEIGSGKKSIAISNHVVPEGFTDRELFEAKHEGDQEGSHVNN